MDELIRQLMGFVRGTWRYRWAGLITAWAVALIGGLAVFLSPDKYQASARIYVDTQSVLKPLMSGLAVQPNVDQQIAILSRTLISRPNVEKVVRMADLDLDIKTKADKERLIDELIKDIQIRGSNRENLYDIEIRNASPDKAKRIVQSFVTLFVESGIGDNRKDADSARKFIQEQIKAYEKKLEEAENRLKEFKLRNLSLDAEAGRDYFTRLSEIGNQLKQAKLDLKEAEQSRDALQRQLAGGEEPALYPQGVPEAVVDTSVPEIDGRIEALQRSLDELLRRYTDQHPDVIGTKRVIAQLEKERKQELAARAKKPASQQVAAGGKMNPVYQQLKISLAESEATVASLRSRVGEYENRLAQLMARAKLQPQIEAEFAQLNRDYDVHKRNYDGLVSRRESANLAGEMESSSSMAEFRLIEPPRVAPKPVAPNRPMLLSGVLAASIVVGIAIAFVLSQVRPTFSDGRTLREISGLPVLGVVSMLRSELRARKERRGMFAFIGGLAALICTYAAALSLLLVGRSSI